MLRALLSALVALGLSGALAWAENPAERALRLQLEAAQVQLQQATQERAKLAKTVAALQAESRTSQRTVATTAETVDETRYNVIQNQVTLDNLKLQVEASANAARKAEAEAKIEKEKTQAALIQAKSDGVKALIWQIFQLAGICALPLVTYWIARRTRAEGKVSEQHMMAKLGEVHVAANNAYQEANTVNQKIASIGLEMVDGKLLDPRRAKRPEPGPRDSGEDTGGKIGSGPVAG